MNNITLNLYIVRNQEGKYFRAKGYGGSGQSWVDDIQKARVYAKIAPARSVVTYFTNTHPKYGIPEILKLNVEGYTVLDEKERVKKVIQQIKKADVAQKKRDAEYFLKKAEETFATAKEELIRMQDEQNQFI